MSNTIQSNLGEKVGPGWKNLRKRIAKIKRPFVAPFVVPFSFDEQVAKSETIQALDIIYKTQSFALCNGDKENPRQCFQTARS